MRRGQISRRVVAGAGAAGTLALGATVVGALAVGAAAVGALAVGALAVGAFSVRRLRLLEGKLEDLYIRRLTIGELEIQSRRGPEEGK